MTFTKADYEDFCKDVSTINTLYDEIISAKKSLYQNVSKELKAIFKKYMGTLPENVHFANDGSLIEVTYSLSFFNEKRIPLTKDLIEELHMPVKIKILDSYRLVFVLLPNVEVSN